MPSPVSALVHLAASGAASAVGATTTGRWSPYSLLILILMFFISLCLLVVFLVLLMTGRFRAVPRENSSAPAPDAGGDETGFGLELSAEIAGEEALQADFDAYDEPEPDIDYSLYEDIDDFDEEPLPTPAPQPEKPLKKDLLERMADARSRRLARAGAPRRKTGLWQCLAAMVISLAAGGCWLGLENALGRMVAITDCTLLLFLMLAAQVTFCVQLALRQRRL